MSSAKALRHFSKACNANQGGSGRAGNAQTQLGLNPSIIDCPHQKDLLRHVRFLGHDDWNLKLGIG